MTPSIIAESSPFHSPMKTIAHVYNYLHPESGGPPQVILQLARAQRELGCNIRLISTDISDPVVESFIAQHLDPLPPRYRLKPMGVRPLWSKRSIDRALKGVDVVHLHSIWPSPCLYVSQRCDRLNIPYVLSLHGHLRPEALGLKALKKKMGLTIGFRQMIEGAQAIHALNHSERRDALRFGLRAPIAVIPNGLRAEHYQESPPRAEIEEMIPALRGHRPYILFLSRIHPRKGADHLVKAFHLIASTFPDLHLVIAGVDHGGLDTLRQLCRRFKLTTRVHFPGFLTGIKKASALRHATIFSLPSLHEGFSVAALEALAWGAPTLLSTGCHFPELTQARAGWIHELGPRPLAASLISILSNDRAAQERANRGRLWATETFNWEALTEAHLKLYSTGLSQD
jgi:glycosyltransferase involved in cell wall biosynthesis